jgi:hypothetical protein
MDSVAIITSVPASSRSESVAITAIGIFAIGISFILQYLAPKVIRELLLFRTHDSASSAFPRRHVVPRTPRHLRKVRPGRRPTLQFDHDRARQDRQTAGPSSMARFRQLSA